MPVSPNVRSYEAIWQARENDPNSVVSALCKKHRVSYQSYNNWAKKNKKTNAVPEARPSSSGSIGVGGTLTVRIPLRDVMEAVRKGKPITIPRDQLIEMLPKEEKQAAYEMIAKAYLKGSRARQNTNGLSSDDGEKSTFNARSED